MHLKNRQKEIPFRVIFKKNSLPTLRLYDLLLWKITMLREHENQTKTFVVVHVGKKVFLEVFPCSSN